VTEALPGHGRHVLVAEDDDTNRTMLVKYLEGKGFRVTAVADGSRALDALRSMVDLDMALLDVMMPNMSGFEALQEARGRGVQTPIIMATAKSHPDDILRALYSGADDYVTKPYSFPVLLARMELRMRTQRAPPPPDDFSVDPADVLEESEETDPNIKMLSAESGLRAKLKQVADTIKNMRPPPVALEPGAKVTERYEIVSRLGEGGFGVVFRGIHCDLDQAVAIKVLRPGASRKAIESFRREAQNACRIRHENAVRVYDFGFLKDGTAFLVMEILDGPTLEDLLAIGSLSVERSAGIAKGILRALDAVHRQNLVHRDVKPSNVILHREDLREVPKLLDFGVATDIGVRDSRAIVGSAAYIAPERILGEQYDGRADVYAFGVLLYRCLTGRYPFPFLPDVDFDKVALWHLHEFAPEPSTLNRALPRAVDALIERLMEKDPRNRPTAAEAETLVEGLLWEL
jgi:serine/threonine protein kinase